MPGTTKKDIKSMGLGDLKKEIAANQSKKQEVNEINDPLLKVNKKRALYLRYKASKMTFILMAILFFSNVYILGARFSVANSSLLLEFFQKLFPFSYVLFTLSICMFGFYYIKLKIYERKNAKVLSLILFAGFGILAFIFLITFIFDFSSLGK